VVGGAADLRRAGSGSFRRVLRLRFTLQLVCLALRGALPPFKLA
jgi:hypothetical protein